MQFKTEGPPLTYSVASLASIPGSLGSEWQCFVQEPGWVKQWHVDSGKTSDMLVSLVVWRWAHHCCGYSGSSWVSCPVSVFLIATLLEMATYSWSMLLTGIKGWCLGLSWTSWPSLRPSWQFWLGFWWTHYSKRSWVNLSHDWTHTTLKTDGSVLGSGVHCLTSWLVW